MAAPSPTRSAQSEAPLAGPSSLSHPHHISAGQPHSDAYQPPLRARLQALLHHADSHTSSSPALSPSSDTPSHALSMPDPQSSATSITSADHPSSSPTAGRSPTRRNSPRGALSVLPKPSRPSSAMSIASQAVAPQLKPAKLPRSITTPNLDERSSPSSAVDPPSRRPPRSSSLDPSYLAQDAPVTSLPAGAAKQDSPEGETRQRPSIKVRIITWNMHDSVPKGDLEVLLGKAGPYVAPEPGWDISCDSADEDGDQDSQHSKRRGEHVVGQEHVPRSDRIPPLPHDDSHPYHVLVIAGQECPWGDGKRLATSVGMAGELGDFTKQKKRAVKDKDKDSHKDKSKPFKLKEKQRSGDSDGVPSVAGSSSIAASEADGAIAASHGDEQGFPFMSTSMSSALPGHPLASPMIGGTSSSALSPSAEAHPDEKLAVWPNIGGKGWSDLCEDWLCRNQVAKKEKEGKDKSFISGARLARALSQSTSRKDLALSRENLAEQQLTMPMQSFSAAVTPELSRAASPVGLQFSASAPGTPNQSTLDGFSAFGDAQNQALAETPASSASADKRKRLVPRLNLNPVDLVKKSASGRSSPAIFTDADCVSSPVLLSPTALPAAGQPFPHTSQALSNAGASGPSTMPVSTSSGGLLAVPGTPTMSRMGSSHSLSKLAKGTSDPVSRSASPAETGVHIEPPTPSRSPSPNPAADQDGHIPRDTPSPAPPSMANAAIESGQNLRAFADSVPKALGPYELVIKERMMGCYMAVYVWRGCKDRVRGASRSHVKSGLLAGRVGNKGGVGISLKLGNTRLLFVNAHLAAHEDKVALRLANVAKIKAALKVDSFLPTSDPRSRLEDITEQFDHTFWFGDLNFRIDISRQHADWLMMNKKYDQALAFDQLGKVLKDGEAFRGFSEAPINFPPTYKYDVLKTLKIKRNKTLNSIRSGVDIPGSGNGSAASKGAGFDLAGTPLGEVIPEEGTETPGRLTDDTDDVSMSCIATSEPVADLCPPHDESTGTIPVAGPKACAEDAVDVVELHDPDRSDEDRFSISSSSAFGSVTSSSGFAQSFRQQEVRLSQGAESAALRERELELEQQRQLAENTSAAQGPRFFSQGAAIKAKFKLMDIVRSAANSNLKDKLGAAGDGQGGGRKKWLNVLTDSPRKGALPASFSSDNTSLLDSSSIASPTTEYSVSFTDHELHRGARRGSLLSNDGLSSVGHGEIGAARRESTGEGLTPLHEGGVPRRSSSQTARSAQQAYAKAQREAKYPHLTGATAEQIDFLEAQPYDTSAKQRVPSWCDRVLFRSTVPVSEHDAEEGDIPKSELHEAGLGSRVGSALSNALITPLRQAAERRQQMHAQRSTSSGLIAAVAGSSSIAFAHEQKVPAEASLVDPVLRKASTTRRDRSNSVKTAEPAASSPRAETRTLAGVERTRPPHLLQRFLHPGRRRNQAKALSPSLTLLDLAQEPSDASWAAKNGSVDLLPTSASLGLGLGSGLGLGLDHKALSSVDLPSQVEERDRRFDGAPKRVASPALAPGEVQARVVIPPRQSSVASSPVANAGPFKPPPPTRSASGGLGMSGEADVGRGGWMDSLSSHLPAFLAPAFSALRAHRHGSTASMDATKTEEMQADPEEKARVVGPRRGTIEVLLYKALDDREMRLLEGRSDHRPVIFVGAIGI